MRNAHEKYPSSTFFGLPDNKYKQTTWRAGYDLTHQLTDKAKVKSIFAVTRTSLDGNPVLATASDNFYSTGKIGRQINNQVKKDTMYTMDNRLETYFNTGSIEHDVAVGVDLLRERSDYYRRNDRSTPDFDINAPSYTQTSVSLGRPAQNITTTQYAGLYAKDNIRLGDVIVGLSARHDWANTRVDNVIKTERTQNSDNAFTGNVSLMYDFQGKIAPYISYGTSFEQNTDVGENGLLLDPETGKQTEVGVKFQGFNKRLQGYVSYYDLIRNNVSETVYDASGATKGYSALVGEQRTKGLELEAALVLSNQWNISGSYSYIPTAEITKTTTQTNLGKRISQIPEHAASFSTQYYFSPDRLGFYVGGGARYQGERTAWRDKSFIDLPAYTLLDLKAGYEAKNWGLGVAVKNVLDKDYLIGTTPNSQLVSYGEPRNVRVALKFKY